MNFLKYKKLYYLLSSLLIIGSLFSIIYFKINLGIEFTGGSIMEIEYDLDRPSPQEIRDSLSGIYLEELTIQPAGEKGYIIKTKEISRETYEEILLSLQGARENYIESIGPSIGKELKTKSITSIILASMAIVLYIAITFNGIGIGKIKSWYYGIIASGVAFFHDVLIVLGLFSVIGHFFNVQVTVPVVVALLTVLGYSINDTVVVFDRIRENMIKSHALDIDQIINKSLKETIGRSVVTSFTTLLVLFSVFFIGGETLKTFILAMIIGISLGTYSSMFLAGPLLSSWVKIKEKNNNKNV
jgi:preprotein translocase subunit SecF